MPGKKKGLIIMSKFGMTAGEFKKRLEGVPDEATIYVTCYETIEITLDGIKLDGIDVNGEDATVDETYE
jgi:hypothetical protein